MRRVPVTVRIALVALCCALLRLDPVVHACTAFCAVDPKGQVLVGNNEDWHNPRTKLWFVPAKPGSYGRVYVGFDDLWPQGGMNERGLWFDGFAAPPMKAAGSAHLPHFSGNIIDKAMSECATVEEVVRLFSQYNRGFLSQSILMFADASGDAVSIEPDAMVRKTRPHFVQTNFHQSRATSASDDRFSTAASMLERAGENISVDLFRRILAATHQEGPAPTLYSNVYDLQSRTMHLYYFHDFERAVTFRLDDELKKGERVLDIPSLFPRNDAAETFANRRREAAGPSAAVVATTAIAFLCAIALVAGYGWMRGGRGFRIAIGVVVGVLGIVVLLSALAVHTHSRVSSEWIEFSIGPASGESSSINSSMVRSNGITLKTALAIAYDIPTVRVIAPPWLADARYAITAVVGVDTADSFRSLLQQELKHHLRLETHLEMRPFDVFVLTADGAPRLERAHGPGPSIWIDKRRAQCRAASMEALAGALGNILNRPVIDETGIAGTYDLEFEWNENRAASLTAALHDRFGLRLTPATREMEALIVDSVRRDAAFVLLGHVGRMTRGAPQFFRQGIAEALTLR